MRVLLAHNSLYYPSFGGGDKSNRLLMQALTERGHCVRVIARVEEFGERAHQKLLAELSSRNVPVLSSEGADIRFNLGGVDVHVLARDPHLRAYFAGQVEAFDPDVILTSTDDPAHLMLEVALRASRARVVFLVRATIALPFGPDASFPSAYKTSVIAQADGVVTVSHYVADYARKWGALDAVHVPISLLEPGEFPDVGRFENRFVTMVNPCAVKGISIFLGLAERFPDVAFAAVPTWGTTQEDIAALRSHANVTVLPAADDMDDIFRQTRVALVPSIWAEARSRVILEAMARGIPVLASDVGGLAEAKLGVPYLLPVNPVVHYRAKVDRLMVPSPEIPPQDVGPWRDALEGLVTDPTLYARLSAQSRAAALDYAANLNVGLFEAVLERIVQMPKRDHARPAAQSVLQTLSHEKRRLLALRLKRHRHVDD